MRYSGTWLTPEDETILVALRHDGPASPAGLRERANLAFSQAYLARRCAKLVGLAGLLAYDDGIYRITERGEAYLDGELDPTEFGPP